MITKEALEYIVEGHRPEIKEIDGEYYVVSALRQHERIPKLPRDMSMRSRDKEGNRLILDTFQGLIDILLHLFPEDHWRIAIFEHSTDVLMNPMERYRREAVMNEVEIVKVAHRQDHALDKGFSYIDLLDWFDLHAEHFQPEGAYDNIRSAIRILKQVETSSLEMEDHGAYIQIAESQVKGVETGGQKIPTRIDVILPFGTTEFAFLHKFRLRMVDKNGFMLKILNRDEIIDQFRRDVKDFLTAELGDNDPCIIS